MAGTGGLQQQQIQYEENLTTHAKLQAYIQQIVLPQLGSLTAGNVTPQSLLMHLTNLDEYKELICKVRNSQNSQNSFTIKK